MTQYGSAEALPVSKPPKRMRQWLVRTLFQGMLGAMRVLPWRPARALGTGMGSAAYRLSPRYRRMADKNLQIAYGSALSAWERRRLTRRVFQNFARATLIEFLKVPFLTSTEVRAMVPMESLAPMQAALARGKGVIVVSAHLGNWELLARRIAMEGISIKVVTRQSPDPAFNAITNSLRENAGYTVHPRGSSPRGLLKHLRDNGVVAILADQKADDGVYVPFFGQPAGTVAGPAVLALKTGAALLPLFAPRRPNGTFATLFLPEVDTTATGDTTADVTRIMGDVTAAIESAVRQYPDQWLWLHDRWGKSVPAPTVPS